MSIIFLMLSVLLLFGLLSLVIVAVGIWIGILASFVAFLAGGALTAVIFHSGQDGFLLVGIGAVVLLWSVLIHNSNQTDKNGK